MIGRESTEGKRGLATVSARWGTYKLVFTRGFHILFLLHISEAAALLNPCPELSLSFFFALLFPILLSTLLYPLHLFFFLSVLLIILCLIAPPPPLPPPTPPPPLVF